MSKETYHPSNIIKSLLTDTIFSLIYFFLLVVITLIASLFLKEIFIFFDITDNDNLKMFFNGIKVVIVSGEGLLFTAFFVSQFVKGLRELKFLCKDF